MNFILILISKVVLIWFVYTTTIQTKSSAPDMCLHSSRFDSMTQFVYFDNIQLNLAFFVVSHQYYWILEKEMPTPNNTKGRLPNDFRGDALFFRQWKRCKDQTIVPMIVVVDKNGTDLMYIIYFIHNQTWTQPYSASEDKALSVVYLYDGLKTVDTIINFANVMVGPSSQKLGAESIFIITTAQNNSIYYDFVRLEGCLEDSTQLQFKGKSTQFFGGLLERGLWKMNKSIDAALVYLTYPQTEYMNIKDVDISLFVANTHYQISVSLLLIENGFLYCSKDTLLAQYYSTWLACALGETPEPPIYVRKTGTETTISSSDAINENITKTWRPTLIPKVPDHTQYESESDFPATLVSIVMVVTVAFVLLICTFIVILRYRREDKEEKPN